MELAAVDWAKVAEVSRVLGTEIIRGAVTLGAVYIGARLALDNARKGRREEMLLKERYSAFQNLTGFLFELEYCLRDRHNLFDLHNAADVDQFIERIDPFREDFEKVHRHTLFNSSDTRSSVHYARGMFYELRISLENLKRGHALHPEHPERADILAELREKENINEIALRTLCQIAINDLFKEQALFTSEVPFPTAPLYLQSLQEQGWTRPL